VKGAAWLLVAAQAASAMADARTTFETPEATGNNMAMTPRPERSKLFRSLW